MKGIGKRVTVAFLSIVALLSVSGVISLFELSNLSYDTEAILSANSRDMEVAKNLLRSAHDHSRAMIDVVIFNNESQKDMSRLQSLVDRRDESFSTASDLMSKISDTRSNLISNL